MNHILQLALSANVPHEMWSISEKEKNRTALAQTAQMLLRMGVSKDDIAKNIGLTPDDLEDLLM